ncbi:MAG: hypothetical protein ACK4Q4_03835, partial [Rhodocyclaceae bacterium]
MLAVVGRGFDLAFAATLFLPACGDFSCGMGEGSGSAWATASAAWLPGRGTSTVNPGLILTRDVMPLICRKRLSESLKRAATLA